jgi:hypothetical protein
MISYEQGLAMPIAYALVTLFSHRFHHVFQQKIVGQEKEGHNLSGQFLICLNECKQNTIRFHYIHELYIFWVITKYNKFPRQIKNQTHESLVVQNEEFYGTPK